MFGIIYFIYGGSVHIVRSIKKKYDDFIAKGKTYNQEPGIYLDSTSKHYSIKSDEQMFFTFDKRGHRVYENKSKDQRIDLTQIEIDERYEYAKKHRVNGETVCELNEDFANTKKDRSDIYGCAGIRFKDLDNGNIYVVRCWNSLRHVGKLKKYETQELRDKYNSQIPTSKFYMDVNNGKLIRVIDFTYEKERKMLRNSTSMIDEEIDRMINLKIECDNMWIEKHNYNQQKMINDGNWSPIKFYHNSFRG